jgi:predicted O-linked N-acetylglucosamine transferase (SPINDLY family)
MQKRKNLSNKNKKNSKLSGGQINCPSELIINRLLNEFQNGRYKIAEDLASSMIQDYPNHPFAWKVLGVLFQQSGRLNESLIYIQKSLELTPNDPEVFSNLGNILQGLGRLADAETSYRKAIELKPDFPEAHNNLGITLQKIGKLEEAIEAYSKAINLKSDFAFAHMNLGCVLYEVDRLNESEVCHKKTIDLLPNYPEAHNNLGVTLHELGNLQEAENSYRKAIELKENFAEAHTNLGCTLQKLKRLDEAEFHHRNAIKTDPHNVKAHINLGGTLHDLGRLEEAQKCFKFVLTIKPDSAHAFNNLAVLLQELGKIKESEQYLLKAIEVNPNFTDAYCNLGNAFRAQFKLDDALTCYQKAIKLNPNYANAYLNLGVTLRQLSKYSDAFECVNRALTIDPSFALAIQEYSILSAYMSNFANVHNLSNKALSLFLLDKNSINLSHFWESRLYSLIYDPNLSEEYICEEHIKWGSQYITLGEKRFDTHSRSNNRKLRIGYASPDFRGHTCRFYFEPLFSAHDRSKFELFAYSNVVLADEHTERLKSYFDAWRDITGLSDEAAAEIIKNDAIDILVDGCGHMQNTRLTVFAYSPAPIQVTWLGAAWTTGLPQMDYVLFDPYMAPSGTVASEKIVHLPRTWTTFRPGEKAMKSVVKAAPVGRNGYLTFGYSGRTERLNNKVFSAWSQILSLIPTARLVLDYKPFGDPKTQTYYIQLLQEHGIDAKRVKMRNSENIFESLGDIDILLDSFPHSGGTMLFDSIWMGVPVLTLASDRPVGRIGTSLMSNLGLTEWVSQSETEYVNKAVVFAQDIPYLVRLRSNLRSMMQSSPVMDENSFARDVETAYKNMWDSWLDLPKN